MNASRPAPLPDQAIGRRIGAEVDRHQSASVHQLPFQMTARSITPGSCAMADMKDKMKDKINDAAEKAKDATDKASDKANQAARKSGQKMKNMGEKIKETDE